MDWFTRNLILPPTQRVGLDSDAMTFLVKAMSAGYDPSKYPSGIAEERIAMLQIFLYADHPLCLTPTVEQEYEAIQSENWRLVHRDVHRFHICDALGNVPLSPDETRITFLRSLHSGAGDCRIAAEAEQAGLTLLLSRDAKFAKRLNPILSGLCIEQPSAYWNSLGISRGTRPRVEPAAANPLSGATWWRWDNES